MSTFIRANSDDSLATIAEQAVARTDYKHAEVVEVWEVKLVRRHYCVVTVTDDVAFAESFSSSDEAQAAKRDAERIIMRAA